MLLECGGEIGGLAVARKLGDLRKAMVVERSNVMAACMRGSVWYS
jgi:hypothetical protein